MNFFRLCLIFGVIYLLPHSLNAQTYSKGQGIVGPDINFSEAADYYAKHPLPIVRRLPFDEDAENETEESSIEPDPSLVHMLHRSASRAVTGSGPAALSITIAPADTFLATLSDGSTIPPDTHGDVSPSFCVTATNYGVHIQKKNGTNSSFINLTSFWSSVLPAGTDPFDPRIHYDTHYQRWILVTDAVNQTDMSGSTLLIAVSTTCNPLGTWHKYAVPLDPSGATWLDFPCVGFNSQWLTVTGNIFSGSSGPGDGAAVYVFNYADILSGTGAPYVKIAQSSSFTISPAITYDSTLQSMFCLEVSSGGSGKLRLWKISGPVSSPTMSIVGYPASSQHWHTSGPGGNDFCPQLGTANKTDAGDNRITRVVYRNHSLWCAHTVFLPDPGTTARCSIMWWQIDTLANPIQNGLIDDPTTPSFFDYASIAVNVNNDVLIGFSYHSLLMHPSSAYAYRLSGDPLDSLHTPFIFRHGQATYYQTFGGAKNRWGDYSGSTVDPSNDLNFWTAQESVPASPANTWDTWWAHVTLYPENTLKATHDTVPVNVVDTVKFIQSYAQQCNNALTWNYDGGALVAGTAGSGPQALKWSTTGTKIVAFTDSMSGSVINYYDTVTVISPNSVNGLTYSAENVHVVPNPNNGSFDVEFDREVNGKVTMTILNMVGRAVYNNQWDAVNNTVPVDLGNLPAGVYLGKINVDGETVTQKITISR